METTWSQNTEKGQYARFYYCTSQGYIIPDRFESWTRVLDLELRINASLLSQLVDNFPYRLRNTQELEGSFFKVAEIWICEAVAFYKIYFIALDIIMWGWWRQRPCDRESLRKRFNG